MIPPTKELANVTSEAASISENSVQTGIAIYIDDELDNNKQQQATTTIRKPYTPPKWRKIMSYAWDSFGLEPEERRFIQRIDFFIFSYSLLSYVIKYLDQGNVSNAYVSGMKEDVR